MKEGSYYQHWKDNEYYFCGIALPLSDFTGNKLLLEKINVASDAHTPKGEPIQQVQLYSHDGLMLIEKETPHVVYQAEKDYETDHVWVREVDDFFGYTENERGQLVKRFALKNKK